MTENEFTTIVVILCYQIPTQPGAGLFESVYEKVLYYEIDPHEI
jgi:hypothetical protein